MTLFDLTADIRPLALRRAVRRALLVPVVPFSIALEAAEGIRRWAPEYVSAVTEVWEEA